MSFLFQVFFQLFHSILQFSLLVLLSLHLSFILMSSVLPFIIFLSVFNFLKPRQLTRSQLFFNTLLHEWGLFFKKTFEHEIGSDQEFFLQQKFGFSSNFYHIFLQAIRKDWIKHSSNAQFFIFYYGGHLYQTMINYYSLNTKILLQQVIQVIQNFSCLLILESYFLMLSKQLQLEVNFIDLIQPMLQLSSDSLDQQKQLFLLKQSPSLRQSQVYNQNHIYRQFYKQQLDDLVQKKLQNKKTQRQKQTQERNSYNQRIKFNAEAERVKDLSYKNYYNTLLNNQSAIAQNYVSPFEQKNMEKDKHIEQGLIQEKKRSDMLYQQQNRRIQQNKKYHRQFLVDQINDKYNRSISNSTQKNRQNEQFKKYTFTPHQLAQFQRQRRLFQIQRYKQDLDKTSSVTHRQRSLSNSNSYAKNDFNVHQIQDKHNPMINPIPFNIQNPYILREMKRRNLLEQSQITPMSHA